MTRRHCHRSLSRLVVTFTLLALMSVTAVCGEAVSGTSSEAEFLSAATKAAHAHGTARNARAEKSFESSSTVKSSNGTSAIESKPLGVSSDTRQGGNSSVTSQVTTALTQLDLGLGYYKMCPFPFSYLHQCETSSECPGSDCCGMYAFPGPSRWRRSCCVPSSVTTIARVARLCIKSDKRPSITDMHQMQAINEAIEHVSVRGDKGDEIWIPSVQLQTIAKSDLIPKDTASAEFESSAEKKKPPVNIRSLTAISEDEVVVLPKRNSQVSHLESSDSVSREEYGGTRSASLNATTNDDLLREEVREIKPALHFIKHIKKGLSSHTSILHEGVKHIHKVHDSFQPKLHDLVKAHLKGGAADDVCPLVRIYHKHCGRPCSTHKHCKDPHYACCKVICDDPWDKHSFKRGLYCHRMVEGKWAFDHSDPPQDHHPWGGDQQNWNTGHPILDILLKHHKNKAPHHDTQGDKKIFLIG